MWDLTSSRVGSLSVTFTGRFLMTDWNRALRKAARVQLLTATMLSLTQRCVDCRRRRPQRDFLYYRSCVRGRSGCGRCTGRGSRCWWLRLWRCFLGRRCLFDVLLVVQAPLGAGSIAGWTAAQERQLRVSIIVVEEEFLSDFYPPLGNEDQTRLLSKFSHLDLQLQWQHNSGKCSGVSN